MGLVDMISENRFIVIKTKMLLYDYYCHLRCVLTQNQFSLCVICWILSSNQRNFKCDFTCYLPNSYYELINKLDRKIKKPPNTIPKN